MFSNGSSNSLHGEPFRRTTRTIPQAHFKFAHPQTQRPDPARRPRQAERGMAFNGAVQENRGSGGKTRTSFISHSIKAGGGGGLHTVPDEMFCAPSTVTDRDTTVTVRGIP
jgi:hypothetical protein